MDHPGAATDARATDATAPTPPVLPAESESDAAALARVASGDFAGFDELVDRYKLRLFRHIRRRIADPHKAEDLTQEAFLRLFRAVRARAASR